ncbi:MAG: efflux RND transporter periplasmic adaptor subunit [Cyanobacteria bacterium]|nr:efflux RND transporter periplasmic adaptor subunit [Cyanobacteriota bacterium]
MTPNNFSNILLDPEETATESPILEAAENDDPDTPDSDTPDPATPPKPWWKVSGKTLLGLGVFTVLTVGILGVTAALKWSSMMADMDGMEGHDMSGMSHDDMMQVDGAFNATPVTVEVVRPAQLNVSVSYTGAIYPYSEVTVYPRVAGQLSNYSIYPGDRVVAGQTLASLEALERTSQTSEATATAAALNASVTASQIQLEEQRQQIQQIQADLDYLQLQRDRFAVLTAEGATSQSQYDQLVSQVEAKVAMLQGAAATLARLEARVISDQAQVDRAQAQVGTATTLESYTQITSPITGIVQARMADPGVVVQPGMGIFKIGDYQRVRLQANVAQQDANRIQVGAPIVATVPGTESGVVEGAITSIFPQTDMTTRTVTVEAVVNNADQKLLSGQFVDMEIVTQRRPNALSIPQKALGEWNGEPAVWVVNGEMAERRPVTTGLTSRDRIEITAGLQPGDQVITSGHSRLMEGSAIAIVDDLGNPVDSFISTKTSNFELVLVSARPAQAGKTALTIALQDIETGEPLEITADNLTVALTMPMKNMAPMMAKVELEATDQPGEFMVSTFFGMKGDWIVEATVTAGDHTGTARLSLPVQ